MRSIPQITPGDQHPYLSCVQQKQTPLILSLSKDARYG